MVYPDYFTRNGAVIMALKVGIQLYSVRDEMKKDPVGTLKKVMEIGYRHLEPANARADEDPGLGCGISADELLTLMQPYGARIGSAHLGPLTDESLPGIVQYHQRVGNKNVVVAIEFYTGYDHVMRRCEDYNRFGKYLVEQGMNPLSYHNHYHEFQLLEGKPILYHILENTDPRYVNFEVDAGWTKRAGLDPIQEMKHVGNRLRLVHIKDFSHTPPNLLTGRDELISWDTFGANDQPGDVMTPEDFSEIGTGMMPIQEIIDTADSLRAEAVVLEQDETAKDIFESIRISMEHFKTYQNLDF